MTILSPADVNRVSSYLTGHDHTEDVLPHVRVHPHLAGQLQQLHASLAHSTRDWLST